MANAQDYPFDPGADYEKLEGLEKLRAVRDRKLAQDLADLWEAAQRNTGDVRFLQRRKEAERARALEEQRLTVKKALAGNYGKAIAASLRQLGFSEDGAEDSIRKAIVIIKQEWRHGTV